MSATLSASNAAITFLANNPRVARVLGRSSDRTSQFAEAEEQDAVNRGTATWHGLESDGFYGPSDVSDFRGINTPSAGIIGGIEKTSPLGDDFRGPIFNTVGNPIDGPIEEGLHTVTPDSRAFEEIMRRNPDDRAFLGDTQLSETLYGDGTAVRDLIENDSELRDAYIGEYSHSTKGLESDLTATAASRVTGTEETDFVNEGDLARLVVENRGDLQTSMNENPDLAQLLGDNPDEVVLERSRQRVIDAVEPLLPNSKEILTRDWLEANPRVALDLFQRPGFRAWVEESHDNARSLLADADRISTRIENGLAEAAANRVNAIPFDEEWFGGNLNLAEAVVADDTVGTDNEVGDWMHSQQNILAYDTTQRQLADDYLVETAMTLTENSLPRHLFENSGGLALMTTESSDVADGLLVDASNINASYPGESSLADITNAYRAWGIGYGERLYGVYEGIA